jgi:hypothetical protein
MAGFIGHKNMAGMHTRQRIKGRVYMIKADIIHPDLLQALAQCGHKANILITDANYSFLTNTSAQARIIWLNFTPG